MTSDSNYFDQLRVQLSEEWPNIVHARQRTDEILEKLGSLGEFASEDTSVVVYGSIGRKEVTEDSDIDWTLLLDGPADPNHTTVVEKVKKRLVELGLNEPGSTETFGVLSNSHELLHHIAGIHDTNQNLTRRVLLLVESKAITTPKVRERVILNILNRYIVHDTTVPRSAPPEHAIPHFLLNDVVRYWRTMASDYAAKMYERGAKGWALRNIKLRFSRKLIFVAGLLNCFSFELYPPHDYDEVIRECETLPGELATHIVGNTGDTPLDAVAHALIRNESDGTARKLIGAYDCFLGVLADPEKRAILNSLGLEEAPSNDVWNEARNASHEFRDAVQALFFDDDENLKQLLIRYGVF